MDRRGATIAAGGLLTAWMLSGASAFGQAARPPARPAPAQAQARPTPAEAPAAQAPVDQSQLDDLLQDWETQSTKLKTLDVTIFRRDDIPEFDEVEYFEGRAIFKSPNLAFIDFKRIRTDDKKQPMKKADGSWDSVPEERIQCTGTEVWQSRSDTRQIFIYPLEKDQAAKAIEEGPLPFLFNMKAKEAKDRYDIAVMRAPNADSVAVSIKPKLDVDKESFSHASVQLDRSYMLPVRIILHAPNGKGLKDFRLSSIKSNFPVSDTNFVGKEPANWKVVRNPVGEDRPRTAPGEAPGASRVAPRGAAANVAPRNAAPAAAASPRPAAAPARR